MEIFRALSSTALGLAIISIPAALWALGSNETADRYELVAYCLIMSGVLLATIALTIELKQKDTS